jgi:hypothetical protein
MQVVEGIGTAASIAIGGGVIAAAAKKGGRWAVAKTIAVVGAGIAIDQTLEAGLREAGASESIIPGVRLAALVVSLILMRRRTGGGPLPPASDAEAIASGEVAVESTAAGEVGKSTGIVPTAPVELGRWGEVRLRMYLGWRGYKPRQAFKTSLGNRYIDWMLDGVAHEAKAGLNVRLTSSIRKQAMKDAELLADKAVDGVNWHFFRGVQDGLLSFLSKLGIDYTVH